MSHRNDADFTLATPGILGSFCPAAPSYVRPGTVAENAEYLAGRVKEVALLFFETQACLDYTEADLPPGLADLPLSWHIHLPLDLPWDAGHEAVARAVAGLAAKAAFLKPRALVLHPPPTPGLLPLLVQALGDSGVLPSSLLLENTVREPLPAYWEEIRRCGCGVCLDLGHLLLAPNPARTLALPGLWERAAMLHVSAPAQGGHASLAALDAPGRSLLRHILEGLKKDSTVVLELFDLPSLAESARLLAAWGREWRLW